MTNQQKKELLAQFRRNFNELGFAVQKSGLPLQETRGIIRALQVVLSEIDLQKESLGYE